MECQSDSFAAGLDTSTGETRWHIERPKGAAWTTPTALPGPTPAENLVLLQSRGLLTAHRPRTGEQVWEYEESCHTVATLTVADGTIFLPAEGLNALKPTPAGVELLWHGSLLRSQNPSPTVHDGRAYVIKPPGILVAGSTEDGSVLWQLRLKGSFWASPVVADGHLWAVNDDGLVQVVRLGDKGELVGSGQIEPGALASPAVADGAVYFRTDTHLWKVAGAK